MRGQLIRCAFVVRRLPGQVMAALAGNVERTMEARIARLESHTEHIQSDVAEIKTDIRRLDLRIESLDQKLNQKCDFLKDSLYELRLSTEKSFARLTLWALTLYIMLAATLLGVMAKGFGWVG